MLFCPNGLVSLHACAHTGSLILLHPISSPVLDTSSGSFGFFLPVSHTEPVFRPATTPALMTDAELSAPFTPFDPFADAEGDDQVVTKGIVHIRLQQRNGRKSLTTIQGLNSSLDLAKLTKAFKKEFCCNGCVVDDKELGRVIQLQGDQRNKVTLFLVEEEIAAKKMIKIHGI